MEFFRKKVEQLFISEQYELRHRIMNLVDVCITIALIVMCIYSLIVRMRIIVILPIVLTLAAVIISAYILNFKNNMQLSGIILSGVCNGIMFPFMFFVYGGIDSGIPIWMVFGLIYNMHILYGVASYILTVFTIAVDGMCFFMAYNYPNIVEPIDGDGIKTLSIYVTMILAALIFGVVFKYQTYLYNKKCAELEKADSAKSELLANVSHEIRTPINSILGMNEMILRKNKDEGVAGYARTIDSAGNTLLALINDLLDMSKIEAGRMELVETNYSLFELLNGCYNMVKTRAVDKGLQLKLEIDPSLPKGLIGDDVRIIQMINNLLTNAIKYTDSGEVVLKATYHKVPIGISLDICVSDTGRGIPKDEMNTLFDTFTRIDINRNRNIEGTGLGLTITKQFTEMMNGSIEVQSELNVGSEFTLHIPQKLADISPIGDYEALRSEKTGKEKYGEIFHAPEARLLIVDDVAMNRDIIELLLERTQIMIDKAQDGEECIEMVKKQKYNIIFMDQMMPQMDGLEATKKIRSMEGNPNKDIPIVLVTANVGLDRNKLYKETGCDEYLTKPVGGVELEKTLLRFLPEELVIKL